MSGRPTAIIVDGSHRRSKAISKRRRRRSPISLSARAISGYFALPTLPLLNVDEAYNIAPGSSATQEATVYRTFSGAQTSFLGNDGVHRSVMKGWKM